MNTPREQHSWRDAAARAEFPFYRPSEPKPESVWAGGYGGGHGWPTTHLGVQARIGGWEVSVDTSSNERRTDRRILIMEALDVYVLEDGGPIELPWTVEVVAESRTIAVDGAATDFAGVRVVGGTRWTGSARIGDLTVKVTTPDPVVVTAIERCDDLLLPDFDPGR